MYYNSVNTTKKIASLNENEPVGWVGLGWQLGYSSIKVIHNFTVDMTDDKWFFQFSNGAISEIIKNGDNFRVQPQI